MRELTVNELDMVAGGFLGNIVIDAVKLANDFLNTWTVSSVGQAFDFFGLGSIHYAADSLGYAIFKGIAGIGTFLGGDESNITYHFEHEWGG
ncbi:MULTISPECIES: hypothetical protein [Tenebrionibacter/Tenebrionicola group]|jgi:hypothetical protein|uniref:Bacteriocin n=2 Tax=Tenebrionibacter/Tenebrionicola group TaxID=2969848 RepID=A0A8K0V818_9ENTR|nr:MULTISPECIES: hypothetical protein [Tenebrionibacter/Tenebrionicola group]MBK4716765.1 hypothetical protein [Tenebrionibacter intestinalis]MBV4413197.1 hypothetical protein [Tenebrionicola larvae]MBV5097035.1 hypothetical protein [Tenebrionicola larvae]